MLLTLLVAYNAKSTKYYTKFILLNVVVFHVTFLLINY